jgi:hypothetical protein
MFNERKENLIKSFKKIETQLNKINPVEKGKKESRNKEGALEREAIKRFKKMKKDKYNVDNLAGGRIYVIKNYKPSDTSLRLETTVDFDKEHFICDFMECPMIDPHIRNHNKALTRVWNLIANTKWEEPIYPDYIMAAAKVRK